MSFDDGAETDPFVEFVHPGVGRIELHGEFDDEYVFSLIRSERGFYESELLWLLERLGIQNGLAIDVGAHIGNHTVFFAKVMDLKTISIEPRLKSVEILRRNIAANTVEDLVTVVNGALGAKPGKAHLEQMVEGNTGSVTTRRDPSGPVAITRLDDLVEEPVKLIKIDVEGDELAVLQGARRLLGKYRPLIVIEAHSGHALDEIEAALAPLSYRPIAIAGRSDNYLFASASSDAPVGFEEIQARSTLLMARRRDQLVRTAVRDLSGQVRSAGLRPGRLDDFEKRLAAIEHALAGVADDLQTLATTTRQLAEVEKQLANTGRRLGRWQQEYRRLSRSRGLRAIHRMRSVLARTGLITESRILTPDEIEASVETEH